METKVFKISNLVTEEFNKTPFLYEHALQEYILLRPELLRLSEQLHEPEITFSEKKTLKYRYDLVVNYNDADVTAIIELKRDQIDDKSIEQIEGYLKEETQLEPEIGILVGDSISESAQAKVQASKNLYAIILDRFDLQEDEIVSTIIYSPLAFKNRDKTKYILHNMQGQVILGLGKGRLMYEIIKSYIKMCPERTLQELKNIFPDKLAGRGTRSNMPIIHLNDFNSEDSLRGRYFKEPLNCNGEEILVCNQWGIDNIEGIINEAKKLGMQITTQNKQ